MSIIFPTPHSAYYVPNSYEYYKKFLGTRDSTVLTEPWPAKILSSKLRKRGADLKDKITKYRLKDNELKPVISKQKVSDIVTTKKVERDPLDKKFQGLTMCIIKYTNPPRLENAARYQRAFGKALREDWNIIVVEPYYIAQPSAQYLSFEGGVYWMYINYMNVCTLSTFHSDFFAPNVPIICLLNLFIFRMFRKFIQGDPINHFRNFDENRDSDNKILMRFGDQFQVRSRYSKIFVNDYKKKRNRYIILRTHIGVQLFLGTWRLIIGLIMVCAFPDRVL